MLLSWAIPKGPSLDPQVKRFAARVEDHPVEYGEFEGVVPDGNYGAGPMIVWDRGLWVPVEDPVQGLEKGKLLFELHGYKVRGRFTLVRTTRSDEQWLLIKKPDAFSDTNPDFEFNQRSVVSGRLLDEVGSRGSHALDLSGFPRSRIESRAPKLMLAESSREPFDRDGWIFELKYDGYRMAAVKTSKDTQLFYRSGREATELYPEIEQAVAALPADSAILDGELVVNDAGGKPSFNLLQQRSGLSRARDIARARIELPAVFFVFDLLGLDGHNLRRAPLVRRREFLRALLPDIGPLRFSDDVPGRGKALFARVDALGLEGVMAKDGQSAYEGKRSASWQKIKAERTGEFVVVGYKIQKDGTEGLGSLVLAVPRGDDLVAVGRVGSGFSEEQRKALYSSLEEARVDSCPCSPTPDEKDVCWVEPKWVATVRYRERLSSGALRFPVFEGWTRRSNEKPRQRPGSTPEKPAREEGAVPTVRVTHRAKVFWPEEGYTKGDLIDYYRAVWPWLSPYLKDRPVVLTRYPNGINGKSFFQKDTPDWTPEWIRRVRIWSEHAKREVDYSVVDSIESLTYLINSGSIPLHLWASRTEALGSPDWATLDLDPRGAPFGDVVCVANEIHRLCEAIEFPTYVKTTGSSGLHVMLPLGRTLTFGQARLFAEIVAKLVVERLPRIATLERNVSAREGRVYVDVLLNGHGKIIVSPFSVRPLPTAPVSMPILWSALTKTLTPGGFTIQNALDSLARGGDPLLGLLSDSPDIPRALERLSSWATPRG